MIISPLKMMNAKNVEQGVRSVQQKMMIFVLPVMMGSIPTNKVNVGNAQKFA